MYRTGLVTELDVDGHRARVQLPDKDGMVTGWLDVLVRTAHVDQDYGLPPVGSQVAVLLDEHDEAGCVLGAVYSRQDVPPVANANVRRMVWCDGGLVEYDATTHVLRVVVPSGGVVEIAGNDSPIALATKVESELDAIKSNLAALESGLLSHKHLPGALMAPPGTAGGPVTGVSGAPDSAPYTLDYEPSPVGAAQAKSS